MEEINKNNNIRISIPQNNIEKFKQILFYVIEKVGRRPYMNESILQKLLYFIDLDYYEKYEEQLMGLTYRKNEVRLVEGFNELIDDMENNKELVVISINPQNNKYLLLYYYNGDDLSDRERQHIDEELKRLLDKNAEELGDLLYKDVPWITAKEQGKIDYEAVFYRTAETSARKY